MGASNKYQLHIKAVVKGTSQICMKTGNTTLSSVSRVLAAQSFIIINKLIDPWCGINTSHISQTDKEVMREIILNFIT